MQVSDGKIAVLPSINSEKGQDHCMLLEFGQIGLLKLTSSRINHSPFQLHILISACF